MKRITIMLLTVCIVLSMAACGTGNANSGKQTASAYLDQAGEATVDVTVDLSGGWSVEFVRGAVYLYDGENTEGKESVAMLITLDQEVYEDHMAEAMADDARKETDEDIYYTRNESEGAYLTTLNDSAYILITSTNKEDIETIVSRFSLAIDQ